MSHNGYANGRGKVLRSENLERKAQHESFFGRSSYVTGDEAANRRQSDAAWHISGLDGD